MNVVPSFCLALLLAATSLGASAQSFVCGGVGQDEQQQMKAEAGSRDLMLTFATSNGSYMADVVVRIRDARGATVLDASCDGPILLADMPGPGTCRVTATAAGASKQRSVSVGRGKRPASATFVWPAGAN